MSRLQCNPDPLKVVPDAQREVWTRNPRKWRCDHEDGRGRCTSRETRGFYRKGHVEYFCHRHEPLEARS